MRRIATSALELTDVPSAGAPWDEIEQFALTYDCYQHEDCADIANARRHDSLDDLRTCLSYEQRRWRHFSDVPEGDDMAYFVFLIERIRDHVEAIR